MDLLGLLVGFVLLQFALYAVPLALLIVALVTYQRRRARALVLIACAVAPFALFALEYVPQKLIAPVARDVEVASWPRKPVTPENLPKVLVTSHGWWVAKTLVGAGPFLKAYGHSSEGWYVYERTSNPDCPSPAEWQQYPPDQDKLKATPCVLAAKSEPPRLQEPHLRLFFDDRAPSRHRPKGGVVSGSTLELRWSQDVGGELIAFWEIPYFDVPRSPPLSLGVKGWARDAHYAPRQYEQRPDPRTFVAKAIGMSTVGPAK